MQSKSTARSEERPQRGSRHDQDKERQKEEEGRRKRSRERRSRSRDRSRGQRRRREEGVPTEDRWQPAADAEPAKGRAVEGGDRVAEAPMRQLEAQVEEKPVDTVRLACAFCARHCPRLFGFRSPTSLSAKYKWLTAANALGRPSQLHLGWGAGVPEPGHRELWSWRGLLLCWAY